MHWSSTRPWDLAAAAAWMVLTITAVFFEWPSLLRVPLGLVFVLFVPGYAFLAALFPERHRRYEVEKGEEGETEEVKEGLEPLERVALSLGLSIAIVPLLGLALNYTPWGIRLTPIVIVLSAFVAAALGVAHARRMALPEDERFLITIAHEGEPWAERATLDKALTVALALSVVIAFGVLVYVLVTPREGEAFTEFYVLGAGGKAACYPTQFDGGYTTSDEDCPRDVQNITLGVVNHEQEAQTYWIRLVWSNETRNPDNTTTVNGVQVVRQWDVTLEHRPVDLEPGSGFRPQYETNITMPEPPYNGTQRFSVQLFLEPPPEATADKAYMESPYRRLHLWVEA